MRHAAHVGEERLIDLVTGLAPSRDAARALAHLESCARCEARFREAAADHERIRGATPSGRSGTGATKSAMLATLAATVLTAAFLGALAWRPEVRIPGAHDYTLPVEQEMATLRSGAGMLADDLAAGLAAYREHRLREAARRLAAAEPPIEFRPLRDLYLASSLGALDQWDEAEEAIDRIKIELLPQPWRDRARWLDYLVQRDLGRADDAAVSLARLARTDGPIGERARAEAQRLSTTERPP